jgi:parvulin-like peptidyl-prolyl isomerase
MIRNFRLGAWDWKAGVVALVLMGVGAGFSSSAAAPRPARAGRKGAANDSMQVLVRVGSDVITRRDVQRRIESLPEQVRANYSTPEGRQQLIDRMVEEKVWLQIALKRGVADRSQVRQQLEQQRRDLLIRTYLNEVMAANPPPADSVIRAYYDAHLDEYKIPATITVRHIQTAKESDAKRVKQLAKKQDWAALAKRWSADSTTRENGGNLGVVTREGSFGALGAQPALAESAFRLPEGAIGGPYRTDRGWHVIKVDDIKPESTRPFEQMKSVITNQLSRQRQQDFYKEKLEEARRSLRVRPDSGAIKSFVSQKKSARDMFNEAQAAATPAARIDAYRRLLSEYPDSDVSPQAQFMIGFILSEELKNHDEAEQAFRELLRRYPKAELSASAQWMIDHMRTEEAPAFINLDEDSLVQTAVSDSTGAQGGTPNPATPKRRPLSKEKGSAKKP